MSLNIKNQAKLGLNDWKEKALEVEIAIVEIKKMVGWKFKLLVGNKNNMEELLPLVYACNKLVIGPVLNQKIGMILLILEKHFEKYKLLKIFN